jgi:hypothetical protein
MFRKLIFLISLVLVLSLFGANVAFGDVTVIEIPVATDIDDVEESADGSMYIDSSDLEFMYDNDVTNPDDLQVVGIRFVDIQIPKGENILRAVVRFDADDVDDPEHVGEAYVIIEGELSPNAGAFEDAANNVSARARTSAQVAWGPEHWSEQHAKYETSDITGIIQEIVNQEEWAAGNALVLIFSQDPDNASTGVLEAEAFPDNATENIDRRATLIVEFGEPVFVAVDPVPADGAVGVVDPTLQWTSGYKAVSHMIYLSTDETIDESDFLAETQMAIHFADLAPGTTYYWRVDEVEAEMPTDWDSWEIDVVGAVVHEGTVWSFTTMTVEAHNPSPSDGATSVSLDAKLSWAVGKDAIMHDVYFGTDEAAVAASDPSTFKGKLMDTSFNPGPLELGTTYYWKVDEFAIIATNPGPVWSFTTKVPSASDPEPQDGEEDTVQSPVLSFSPSVKAVEHDLYFGDDADAVASADVNTPDIYIGRQAETSYEPGELEWDKTYYWRVDEVNELDAGSPWKGTVWSFTTADFLIIDLSETVLDYDNSAEPYTSEASWDTPKDLTVNGVTDLMFRFQGAPGPEGSASLDEATGTYTITGSGADIWGSSDQFHYMYRKLSGDGEIVAHVVDNGTGTNAWAKGGVMIRETLDANSKHMLMALTGGEGGGIAFQGRPETGGRSNSYHGDITASPPYWVKLTRVGNTITAYSSADGVDWVLFTDTSPDGAQTNPIDVEMAADVYIGLFVTSHQSGELRTYTFDNVSTKGKVGSTAVNQDIGISFNSAESIYVALEDGDGALGVVTNPELAATQIAQWWTMKVPLLTFSDAGVNVADANNLYIGVGDVDNPTAGGSGTIRIDDIRVVKPISILEAADITAPGDNVRGVPNDGDWPGAETPPLAVDDNVNTKYLHFKGDFDPDPGTGGAGFQITPSAGPTIVTGLTFTTANDVPGRDPVAFEIYGSNVSIDGPYNLIASGDIVDFNDATEWPRFTMNTTPITFENATVYKHYQILFTAIRGPVGGSVNSMQIAEVELIGVTEDVLVDITSPGNTIYGYPTDSDWPSSESPRRALDNDIRTNYRHYKGEKQPTGFVVTPSSKKVVNRLTFTTAADHPERDPVAFTLYGSDDHVYTGPWTLIASGKIDDFNQETAWPRLKKNETPVVFNNKVAYKHYRLMVTAVRDAASADSMQVAEVELIEALK